MRKDAEAAGSGAVNDPEEKPTRQYPLVVEGGANEEGTYYMSKGHHSFVEFMAAATAYCGGPLEGLQSPAHQWLRVVPDPDGEHRRGLLIEAKPHSRGAFPVTIIEGPST